MANQTINPDQGFNATGAKAAGVYDECAPQFAKDGSSIGNGVDDPGKDDYLQGQQFTNKSMKGRFGTGY